jgi:hypothetical protein
VAGPDQTRPSVPSVTVTPKRPDYDQGGQRGRPDVGEELAASEVEVAQDDQIGEVRSRQKQGPSI